MPCTTFLPESLQNLPTSDDELNELIKEARKRTGEGWHVVEYPQVRKRFLRKPLPDNYYQLCKLIAPGEAQVIAAATRANEVRCYLLGLLSGMDQSRKNVLVAPLPPLTFHEKLLSRLRNGDYSCNMLNHYTVVIDKRACKYSIVELVEMFGDRLVIGKQRQS